MSVQTTEAKKEEFRNYLEKAGVIDQLTKVLVGLYEEPEKPGNAIEFIKKCLGAPSDVDVEALKSDNEELRRTKAELEKKIEDLKRDLEAEIAKQQWSWDHIYLLIKERVDGLRTTINIITNFH